MNPAEELFAIDVRLNELTELDGLDLPEADALRARRDELLDESR